MTDRTDSRVEAYPNCGMKQIILRTGTTVTGATDTLTLTLADYGLTRILSIYGVRHSTDYSVIVGEAVTSAVSGGVLTITTVTSNDNERRLCVVIAE
jgi:hypothetical protein